MFCFMKYMLSLLVMFMSLQVHAMRAQEFDHSASFNEPMRRAYQNLKASTEAEILSKFKECCVNGDSIDPRIETELHNIVRNKAGRETLLLITARLHPYMECVRSLEKLSDAIPYSEQTEVADKLKKAKLVVLLCKALEVQGADVFLTAMDIDKLLKKLEGNPVVFPDPGTQYERGSLLTVFKCELYEKKSDNQSYVVDGINEWWGGSVQNDIRRNLYALRKGMFRLSSGASTEYRCSSPADFAEVVLSNVRPSIKAKCITGPLLCDIMDGVEIPMCYALSDRYLTPACGLHHEIFHHLVVELEGEKFPSFAELLRAIGFKVDGSYLLELGNIYTSMTEFRDIIGVFVSSGGALCFDPCSEAAYRCAEGEYIRGTHNSNSATILYVPVTFVKLLAKSVPRFKIESSKLRCNIRGLSWC